MAATNEEKKPTKPPSVLGKDDSKPVLQDPIETEEGVLRLPPSSLLPDHQETLNTKMGPQLKAVNDEGHEVDEYKSTVGSKSVVSPISRLWKTEFTKPTLRILIVSNDMSLSELMTEALGEYEVRDQQDADFLLLHQLTNFLDVVTALKNQFDIGSHADVLLLDLDTLYKKLDGMEKIRESQDEEKRVWNITAPESPDIDAVSDLNIFCSNGSMFSSEIFVF
ncbi:hypothetical protein ABKV19_010503 [Rosa sericea]